MPDPVDWSLVLESPIFWGAVMTLLGVLTGHWWAARGKKDETELAGLKASVEVLRAEYERLNGEVKELRESLAAGDKRYRILTEKYSASLIHVHTLRVRLTLEGVPEDQQPPIPEIIAIDMQPFPANT